MTEGTYITDITHFLDETGEMPADLPKPAASFESFLVLIIDSTTETGSSEFNEIGLRCRQYGCTGSILSRLESKKIITIACNVFAEAYVKKKELIWVYILL